MCVFGEGENFMKDSNCVLSEDIEIIDTVDYSYDVSEHFCEMPKVAKPLLQGCKKVFEKIEEMLYTAPAFINLVEASIPQQTFQAILTDEQKRQLAQGSLKLMTKKDGSLMANLINPENSKIVSTIPLESVNLSPNITEMMTNYATQMQMAQIAEDIHAVQLAIEEVRQGQEFDRLAMAYSCQQKLLQAMQIKNPELKAMAFMRIAFDAEDSRNLLIQSQNANLNFIKEQPESFWGKMISGAKSEKINQRMTEIRESLAAVNMVSLSEAMAYQELGESAAARQSLQYYADYLENAYLSTDGLVQRLDLIDPSPENYWSKTLPNIRKRIQALPCIKDERLLEGEDDGK